VHSPFSVGFDMAKTMGVGVFSATASTTSRPKAPPWPERPRSTVTLARLTTSSMLGGRSPSPQPATRAGSCAMRSLYSSRPLLPLTTRPRESTT